PREERGKAGMAVAAPWRLAATAARTASGRRRRVSPAPPLPAGARAPATFPARRGEGKVRLALPRGRRDGDGGESPTSTARRYARPPRARVAREHARAVGRRPDRADGARVPHARQRPPALARQSADRGRGRRGRARHRDRGLLLPAGLADGAEPHQLPPR